MVSLLVGACAAPTAAPTSAPSTMAIPSPPTASASPSSAPPSPPSPSPSPTLVQLVGQKLVVRMDGLTPSADLLGRIRRGEISGVILFGFNVTTSTALSRLTAMLRAAALAGGQPSLLIAVDQEGGAANRLSWAPPTLSPPQMGAQGSAAVAREEGASTGAALAGLGLDVDLAPVADVPASNAVFMAQQGRTFSPDAARTALLADAFATGLEAGGVVPAMKHFPGLGDALQDTDSHVVTIGASTGELSAGLAPYRLAISHGLPLIMLSNAVYTAYDAAHAAGWSAAIGTGLLRGQLGFTGATITDSLDGTAHARGVSDATLAVQAAAAGTDLILLTGSESTSKGVYATLLRDAGDGTLPMLTLQASYARILALKAGL